MKRTTIQRDFPLILASASPRRERLLSQVGLPFRAVPSRVQEGEIKGSPTDVTPVLAGEKALEVYRRTEGNWILGADTTVAMGDRILGKPQDGADARAMLRLLSGREHRVITGFCVVDPSGGIAHSEAVCTSVRFKDLSEQEISGYVETREPFGKAGGYAIQGIGAFLVENISGSYTNVVGLPVCAVVKALRMIGALERFPDPAYMAQPPDRR